jgi:hypothetical protein
VRVQRGDQAQGQHSMFGLTSVSPDHSLPMSDWPFWPSVLVHKLDCLLVCHCDIHLEVVLWQGYLSRDAGSQRVGDLWYSA